MKSCKEISELVSQSLDARLPLGTRFQVWMHLGMCRICSSFRRGLILIRQHARSSEADQPLEIYDPAIKLSAEARSRIQDVLDSQST